MRELDFCGIASGNNVDKSGLFTPFFDAVGQAPMIDNCSLNFLCKVCDSKAIRGFTMFFGEVVAAFANEDCLTEGSPDPLKLDPIIMIGFNYCGLKNMIGQPFLEGIKRPWGWHQNTVATRT